MIKVTELFYSIQGEGRHVGKPSVFLRTFGCNFQCRGFNMPDGEKTNEPEKIIESLDFDKITSVDDIPLSNTGCDSFISWHPSLKHLSKSHSIEDLSKMILDATPNGSMVGIDLVITGGEPLLGWQKFYPELIESLVTKGLRNVTFETNGTKNLQPALVDYIVNSGVNFHFSVSTKLPHSGESWESAVKPDVVANYVVSEDCTVDLKFVVDPDNIMNVQNVHRALDAMRASYNGNVYLMSEGGTETTYNRKKRDVAALAMDLGVCYSPRLQATLFGNEWGT